MTLLAVGLSAWVFLLVVIICVVQTASRSDRRLDAEYLRMRKEREKL